MIKIILTCILVLFVGLAKSQCNCIKVTFLNGKEKKSDTVLATFENQSVVLKENCKVIAKLKMDSLFVKLENSSTYPFDNLTKDQECYLLMDTIQNRLSFFTNLDDLDFQCFDVKKTSINATGNQELLISHADKETYNKMGLFNLFIYDYSILIFEKYGIINLLNKRDSIEVSTLYLTFTVIK